VLTNVFLQIMIYCPTCGNPLPDGSRVCNKCGQLVSEQNQHPTFATGSFGIPSRPSASGNELTEQRMNPPSVLAKAGPLLLLAVACWGGFSLYRTKQKSQRASLDAHCAELSQLLVKAKPDASATRVIAAVYSSRRNSCLAAVEHRDGQQYFVQVVDPTTDVAVWTDGCRTPDNCNEQVMSSIRTRSKVALDKLGAER
jgi:hypothetical protein